MNEIINGWVRRQYQKEQFFISNSISAFLNMMLFYGIQTQFRKIPSNQALPQATKYLMFLCISSMIADIYIISKRDVLLQRKQNIKFGIIKIDSNETLEEIKERKYQERENNFKKLVQQNIEKEKEEISKML
ncbi:hypothetical protein PPERSA_09644 [Pseudocohnilembus persalinus]|uniref:Transmembrane protein n=1 Tax=Pseudocohnilembus persalinus TaxID=266149 RepID=A0A0V0QFQ2_PSEPJ|nr:hypothetical protein PPERSA_09644 [Pseudocohnilembus persalinus]|eukprot:KRX01038.1 hypothetical protein PPERSA_09644 [Pseudocohnilembus persalinus]